VISPRHGTQNMEACRAAVLAAARPSGPVYCQPPKLPRRPAAQPLKCCTADDKAPPPPTAPLTAPRRLVLRVGHRSGAGPEASRPVVETLHRSAHGGVGGARRHLLRHWSGGQPPGRGGIPMRRAWRRARRRRWCVAPPAPRPAAACGSRRRGPAPTAPGWPGRALSAAQATQNS